MEIETFENPQPAQDYLIQHVAEEFTSVCPKTGHPDFGVVVLSYMPDQICVELKAYKEFLHAFRDKGIFYEAVTNEIFGRLWQVMSPRWMRVETLWKGRGGIRSVIRREDRKPGVAQPSVPFTPLA